ncbi:MAG TPA: serine/threonine-protein kinase, partial [Vicinamibacteria bacterium]
MIGSHGLWKALRDLVRGRTPSPGDGASGPPEDATLAQGVPERFGPYRVRRKLGQGGMGIVYEAHDERLERSLAIKVIARDAADETTIRRFWREARAAAAVNHPNVCQLYELGEHEGSLYIAMELLEGEPLAERLRKGALPLAEAMPIAFGMLAALEALHARGLVHRDLKPSNVFLTPHGVKLLDFGLARKAVSVGSLTGNLDSGPSELTRPGMILGTPRYMAPEQVRGDEVDGRADLFAVGAILFEMLAGRPPFTGKSAVEVFYATLHEQPPALTGSPAVVATDRVIRKALQKRA